jgi:ParB-like chromosome segregation protein Spo0J
MIIDTDEINKLPIDEKINKLNEIKIALHEISPFQEEPVDCVIWIKCDDIHANDYNPNHVASPEMKLLHTSIKEDGYTQPIVSMHEDTNSYVIIDGFHRSRVGKEYEDIKKRILGYLPITIIRNTREKKADRMASTIRHNRARGVHTVDGMSSIVISMLKAGWSDEKIAKEMEMDADELIRLKQVCGIADIFKGKDYNRAWE